VDIVEGGVRAVSSSSSSPATKATRSIAWSYEPSPPQRRATTDGDEASDARSCDDLRVVEAHVEQLVRMSQLMRALSAGGA
jgi:hypothetical protein